jgi:hypothetical protein
MINHQQTDTHGRSKGACSFVWAGGRRYRSAGVSFSLRSQSGSAVAPRGGIIVVPPNLGRGFGLAHFSQFSRLSPSGRARGFRQHSDCQVSDAPKAHSSRLSYPGHERDQVSERHRTCGSLKTGISIR